jgi:hypothetical protein
LEISPKGFMIFVYAQIAYKSIRKMYLHDIPQEEKEAVIQDVVSSIVIAFPKKIAEGFTFNFRTVLLVNIIGLLVLEVLSRIYP